MIQMKERTPNTVKAADIPNNMIIGTFEGECADARVTNKNGLDITDEVWIKTFDSDEYKKGIERGHFIGFLGHPENIDCQDFRNGCIVMTEGHIDNDTGKVYGKFNLINTPVGQIVKAFIDAGVKFGISVRGMGDIYDNSVDPDTFVFRGFDLVAFPAYDDAIPEFVAASSDIEKQKKYKVMCSTVSKNLDKITSAASLDIMQKQFAKQSDEYAAIEARKCELCDKDEEVEETIDISGDRLEAVTQLYLDASDANRKLVKENTQLKKELQKVKASYTRRFNRLQAITSAQYADMNGELDRVTSSVSALRSENARLKESVKASKSENLKYSRKVTAAQSLVDKADSEKSAIQDKLDKTVVKCSTLERRASNLGEENSRLRTELSQTKKVLASFRSAYANLYAGATGIDPSTVDIKAASSVEDIKQAVLGSCNIDVTSDDVDIEDFADDFDDQNLVTV